MLMYLCNASFSVARVTKALPGLIQYTLLCQASVFVGLLSSFCLLCNPMILFNIIIFASF